VRKLALVCDCCGAGFIFPWHLSNERQKMSNGVNFSFQEGVKEATLLSVGQPEY
jgi:hypothetical protein